MDQQLPGPVELHCLGGFVAATLHGLSRPTNDVDYVEIVPQHALQVVEQLAGRESVLARRSGVYFQHVTVASLPESYDGRLTALFPARFRNLRLFALDPHDLALSKLSRNSPVDREDVAYLANAVPLDSGLLQDREAAGSRAAARWA
ncbi:MAG: hypothetical protein HYU88_13305 [Chloroflexi bacterium]|nr:hypothetical protein [Chloroflexota bacterium]